MFPGVRMAFSPGGVTVGLVRINCGTGTLAVWTGGIGPQGKASNQEPRPQDRRTFLSKSVTQNYLIAGTVRHFPGLGNAYRMSDGFYWGSIEVRHFKREPARHGQVFVAPAEN